MLRYLVLICLSSPVIADVYVGSLIGSQSQSHDISMTHDLVLRRGGRIRRHVQQTASEHLNKTTFSISPYIGLQTTGEWIGFGLEAGFLFPTHTQQTYQLKDPTGDIEHGDVTLKRGVMPCVLGKISFALLQDVHFFLKGGFSIATLKLTLFPYETFSNTVMTHARREVGFSGGAGLQYSHGPFSYGVEWRCDHFPRFDSTRIPLDTAQRTSTWGTKIIPRYHGIYGSIAYHF